MSNNGENNPGGITLQPDQHSEVLTRADQHSEVLTRVGITNGDNPGGNTQR